MKQGIKETKNKENKKKERRIKPKESRKIGTEK
jgi:hypothetical protein